MMTVQLSTSVLSTTLFVAALFSCNNPNGNKAPNQKADTIHNFTQNNIAFALDTVQQTDSSIVHVDTATILGQHYTAIYRTDDYFFVINSTNDTVFSNKELCPNFEFDDFDKDGYKDIRFHYMANSPIEELVLFDKQAKIFRKVANFNNYPEPEKIIGTKYYYSYHKSGCADMNWESDLFYIENFKTFRIGNISGIECHDRDKKDGIYINKVTREKNVLYETLSVEILGKYKDYKWGFIKEYWTKNYTTFE